MNNLDELPPPRGLPSHRRLAARRQLEAIAAGGPIRGARGRLRTIGALAAAAVLGSAVAAIAYATFQPVTDRGSARCYTAATLAGGPNFDGTTIAAAGTPGTPAQADDALGVCGDLWRQGFLTAGAKGIQRPAPSAVATNNFTVPPLVACTMPSGIAAVFPGNAATCARLGLPAATTQSPTPGP